VEVEGLGLRWVVVRRVGKGRGRRGGVGVRGGEGRIGRKSNGRVEYR